MDELTPNGIAEVYDLQESRITEKNWIGACCGVSYFIIGTSESYNLYDKSGHFIKCLPIAEAGNLSAIGNRCFSTLNSDGIERLWWEDGTLKEEHKLTPDQIKEIGNIKILRKGEFIG